jgi:hypothetical protein
MGYKVGKLPVMQQSLTSYHLYPHLRAPFRPTGLLRAGKHDVMFVSKGS